MLEVLIWALALALWRRWLGAEGTGPRSVKLAVLAGIVAPLSLAAWWAGPLAYGIVVPWFLIRHDNWAHPWRYPGIGHLVLKLEGCNLPDIGIAHGWTEYGELILGAATVLVASALYHAGVALLAVTSLYPHS